METNMTSQKALDVLERHNLWRRGADHIESTDPKLLGIAIDKAIEVLRLSIINNWVLYDPNDISKRPTKYGKYLVYRKDGKIHWETWNGSGWAYNGNVITHWMEVKPPC